MGDITFLNLYTKIGYVKTYVLTLTRDSFINSSLIVINKIFNLLMICASKIEIEL